MGDTPGSGRRRRDLRGLGPKRPAAGGRWHIPGLDELVMLPTCPWTLGPKQAAGGATALRLFRPAADLHLILAGSTKVHIGFTERGDKKLGVFDLFPLFLRVRDLEAGKMRRRPHGQEIMEILRGTNLCSRVESSLVSSKFQHRDADREMTGAHETPDLISQ